MIHIDVFSNIIESNHKSSFLYLLKNNFANDPIEVQDNYDSNILLPYIKKLKVENDLTLNSKIDQYFMLNDIDKEEFLLGIDGQQVNKKTVNIISEAQKMLVSDVDDAILTDVIKEQLNSSKFMQACYFWNIYVKLSDDQITNTDIQRIISKNIQDNDPSKFQMLTQLIGMKGEIEEQYTAKVVTDNPKIKRIITALGYKLCRVGFGKRAWAIDSNVNIYSKYFKI